MRYGLIIENPPGEYSDTGRRENFTGTPPDLSAKIPYPKKWVPVIEEADPTGFDEETHELTDNDPVVTADSITESRSITPLPPEVIADIEAQKDLDQERDRALALLAKFKDGTATNAQVKRAVYFLLKKFVK